MSAEGAMKWLVCVAEGDREGLTINEHTAKMAVGIRWEIDRLRAFIEAEAVTVEALKLANDAGFMLCADTLDYVAEVLRSRAAKAKP